MTIEEIQARLCYYDRRNPDGYIEFLCAQIEMDGTIEQELSMLTDGRRQGCKCDNCTTGRAELAEIIMAYKKVTDFILDTIGNRSTKNN